ncbi:leucine-rich repeat domain-containing protein [uncultured Gemmiger sp.]|uniref:leucine-rich repeat domain-containing protein n=1 Tax=uncultured Gemmiger sp. TaxID=1623490 RepID=UPI0025E41A90|nr:leucine-rich repeat domain-containing protein [uncultured Gemmiger sp.]
MKRKLSPSVLIAVLPAVVTLAVVLLDAGTGSKAARLYAAASQAVEEQDYATARSVLDNIQTIAPGYVPAYELEARIDLATTDRKTTLRKLDSAIRRTGSRRLIQLMETIEAGGTPDPLPADSGAGLPDTLPETWAEQPQEEPAEATLTDVAANYDVLVRYTDSDWEKQVQLVPGDGGNDWTWSSDNTAVAQVDDNGLVTCGSLPGEALVTAVNGSRISRCFVLVMEPEIYYDTATSRNYCIPEGNLRLQNRKYAIESGDLLKVLPTLQVQGAAQGQPLSAGALEHSAGSSVEVSGPVDENGTPILLLPEETSTPETAQPGTAVSLQIGWESLYGSGDYHIPDTLRANGTTYTPTAIDWDMGAYFDSLYLPASMTSLDYFQSNNPLAGCPALQQVTVEAGNPSYSSRDGVLFDAGGTTLIGYPIDARANEYTVPDGVTAIGADAFADNANLQTLTIPDSVTSIDSTAFAGMRSLQVLNNESALDFRLQDGVLTTDGGATVLAFCSGGMPEQYTLSANVTRVADGTFADNQSVKELTVDASLGSLSVNNCSALETLTVNGDLSWLSVDGCDKLKQVVINGTVERLVLDAPEDAVLKNAGHVSDSLSVNGGRMESLQLAATLTDLTYTPGGEGATVDLSPLAATSLTMLQVSNASLTGLDALAALPDLQSVYLLNIPSVDSWNGLWRCASLQNLSVSSTALTDISGISALTELRTVDLSNCGIADASPLANCRKLQYINLGSCEQLTDIGALLELPELNYIQVYGTGLSEQQQQQVEQFNNG